MINYKIDCVQEVFCEDIQFSHNLGAKLFSLHRPFPSVYSLLAYKDWVGNAERVYSMLQNCIGLMEENILQMGPSLQLGAPPPDLGRQRISALNPQDAPYIPEDFIPV